MISLNGFYEYTGYWITEFDFMLLVIDLGLAILVILCMRRIRKLEDRIQRSQDEEP